MSQDYHLYGAERGACTLYSRTLDVWAMTASAHLYRNTPLWFYHRVISALHKIDRRESKGVLVYAPNAPKTRYTTLPLEIRFRIKDWLKAIINADEIMRRGSDEQKAFDDDLHYTRAPEDVAMQAIGYFHAIFQQVFVQGEHSCQALFPSDCYDTEHFFYRDWKPLAQCAHGCTPEKVWQRVEKWLEQAGKTECVRDKSP